MRQAHKLPALLILFCATILLATAVPRLKAALWHGPVETYLEQYYKNGRIPENRLPRLKAELEKIVRIHPTAQYHQELATVDVLLARGAVDLTEYRSRLEEAQAALEESLRLSPANPYAWHRLAVVGRQRARDPTRILQAFSLSVFTGPAERQLLLDRLDIALALGISADDETKNLIRQQLRLAWQLDRFEIIKLAGLHGQEALLSEALSYGMR